MSNQKVKAIMREVRAELRARKRKPSQSEVTLNAWLDKADALVARFVDRVFAVKGGTINE